MEEIAAMGEAIAETAAIVDVATHRFLTQLRLRIGPLERAARTGTLQVTRQVPDDFPVESLLAEALPGALECRLAPSLRK